MTASWGIELRFKDADVDYWNSETESGRASAYITCYVHDYRAHDSEFYVIDIFYDVIWDEDKQKYLMKETKRESDHWEPTNPDYQ